MPLHVYNCKCGNTFERFENINDIADKRCPVCRRMAEIGPGLTGTPILKPGGAGGFYKPSKVDS